MAKEQKSVNTAGGLSREEWIKRERDAIGRYIRDGETAQRLAVEHYESENRKSYEKLRNF